MTAFCKLNTKYFFFTDIFGEIKFQVQSNIREPMSLNQTLTD